MTAWTAEADPVTCSEIARLSVKASGGKTFHADFVEERHIRLLKEPLVSRGEVTFTSPDVLEMDTTSPHRQTVIITNGRIRTIQHDLGREETVDLGAIEPAREMVLDLLKVLGGRFDEMTGRYECTAGKKAQVFQLRLVPHGKRLQEAIAAMDVKVGPRGEVLEVTTTEACGDKSTLVFSNIEYGLPKKREDVKTAHPR